MSGYAYARRGARVVACVLALGVAKAAAQEVPTEESSEKSSQSQPTPATGTEAVKPAEPTSTQPSASTEPGTSNLPELVVDGQDKKKKKAAKKDTAPVSATVGEATTTEPPPGVTLGTGAPSDTGTTTFDANNVQLRTDGGNDANTFMRNLPNIQYQNYNASNPGASSVKTVDTKPLLLSISGGRTYENNFILNGVSISNITGPVDLSRQLTDTDGPNPGSPAVLGMSPQNIYVPAEFIGQATVVDSNASAEYGQFQGGVVIYDLIAPPTDRYHATVSASRDSSEFATYVLATPTGTNPTGRRPPSYEKTTLSASVGAPITRDFSFIGQVSRKEVESGKPKIINIGGDADEYSDNTFMRFAATARTDIGKFTLDTSRTDYFQHWEYYWAPDTYLDVDTQGTSTKLEHEVNLAGLRADEIGLGGVKLKSRAFYNTNVTRNNSSAEPFLNWTTQYAIYDTGTGTWQEQFSTDLHECQPVDPSIYPPTAGYFLNGCWEGGYGNQLQGQTDYGAQATLSGNVLLGNFIVGTEIKKYEGRSARLEDHLLAANANFFGGPFTCLVPGDILCDEDQYFQSYIIARARDVRATLNAVHSFAEIDQTWEWFNVRAGVRHDYDDYFKNDNIAPRLAATIVPFDGVSLTGGYNRYYIGETLYYAIRDGAPPNESYFRATPDAFNPPTVFPPVLYRVQGLNTPYNDEYTGAVGIRDPLFDGHWRLKYLERYGRDQFATISCGNRCSQATNDGEKFYRSAVAEYAKEWNRLNTPFGLHAAAVTGNVTWSEQENSLNSYLGSDLNGDGTGEPRILYKGDTYLPEQFAAVTGNLDIPVRFGATLATVWFDNTLQLNLSAGVNLGFQGVGYVTDNIIGGVRHAVYEDRKFGAALKLDVSGQINVTDEAAIEFSVSNITNSTQNTITSNDLPWVLGRSYWVGSALRF
jgi:hypothetical protein